MNKTILFIGILLTAICAQPGIEITPFGAFQWNGTAEFYEGNVEFDHRGSFGVYLNLDLPAPGTQLEVSYTGNPTEAHWRPYAGWSTIYPRADSDVFINYWQIGALKSFGPAQSKISPYVQTSIGATYFSFDKSSSSNTAFFSFTAGLGAKVYINKRIGIRIGSRFMVPLDFTGGGFYFGTGGGGTYAYARVPVLQGDVHGGIIIRLGGSPKEKQPVPQQPIQQKPLEQPVEQPKETRVEEVSPTEVLIIQE